MLGVQTAHTTTTSLTDARHDLPNLYTQTWISDFQLPHIFLFLIPTDGPLFYYLFRRRTGMDNWIVLGELPLAANMGEICAVYATGACLPVTRMFAC